jgi:hypothetical protein
MALTRTDQPAPVLSTDAARRPAEAGWNERVVATLRDAEDWLDWLEARGYVNRDLVIRGNAAFAVRWR